MTDYRPTTPPEWDYEGGKECSFCGKPMSDLSKGHFCSKECRIAEYND